MKFEHKTKIVRLLYRDSERIHLNPSWQRGPVWNIRKKSLLIDSILRGYDIPELYFRRLTPGAASDIEVVDGQQRLRAIMDYLDGKYCLVQDLDKVGTAIISGKYFSDLSPKLKKKLREFKLRIAYISGARATDISQFFSRMQMGMRLLPSELRNAVQTGLRHALDGLAREHPFFKNSKIPSSRFKHQDYLAHAFSVIFHSASHDLKAPQLMEDYKTLKDPTEFAGLLAELNIILSYLAKLNIKISKILTQKWIFVDLTYWIHRNMSQLNNIDIEKLAESYLRFNNQRLQHTATPEVLISNHPTKADKELYNYIIAFKAAGATKANIKIRQRVISNHFQRELGV